MRYDAIVLTCEEIEDLSIIRNLISDTFGYIPIRCDDENNQFTEFISSDYMLNLDAERILINYEVGNSKHIVFSEEYREVLRDKKHPLFAVRTNECFALLQKLEECNLNCMSVYIKKTDSDVDCKEELIRLCTYNLDGKT